jgi:hypothetical protein
MWPRSRRIPVLIVVLTIGLGVADLPDPTAASGGCRASYATLGQAPGLTGPTPTDWFNILGEDFDPTVPATLTFDVPVIPWSIDQPTLVQPALTTFQVPAASMSAGFKWTFRTRDPGVQVIHVDVAGLGCQASTIVDFTPPASSTADIPTPSEPAPVTPLLLVMAFVSGMVAALRWFDHRPRARSSR